MVLGMERVKCGERRRALDAINGRLKVKGMYVFSLTERSGRSSFCGRACVLEAVGYRYKGSGLKKRREKVVQQMMSG